MLQHRHGERGNIFTELWLFRQEWWRRNFQENGFAIIRDKPMGIFYTGNAVGAPSQPRAARTPSERIRQRMPPVQNCSK